MKKILLLFAAAFALQGYAQCWEKVSCGSTHSAALKSDGTLWTWGNNSDSQLGYYSSESFVKIPMNAGGDTDWTDVSAGGSYTAALKTNGSLWIWGNNINMWYDPVYVPHIAGEDYDWKNISAGETHLLAIKTDGTLWKWDATPQGDYLPNKVGIDTDWEKISTGNFYSAAIKTDGTLWTWGNNEDGQLGYVTAEATATPAQVGMATDWKEISCNGTTTAAIKIDGTLWFWGSNSNGEFGNGIISANNASPMMTGTDTDWKSVSVGHGFVTALKTDNTLWGWGIASVGISANSTLIPVQLSDDTNWESVSAGSAAAALKIDATLWSAGDNTLGQTGVGSSDAFITNFAMVNCTVQIPPDSITMCWRTIAAGGFATVAINEDGTLWGWGSNMSNPLGDQPETVDIPAQIGTDNNWAAISVGNSHTVALKTDGTLWAWGRNDAGQVGNGEYSLYPVTEPLQIGTDNDWTFVCASGGLASAAIKADGTLWTWGFVNTGESLIIEEEEGDVTTLFITEPTQMGTDTNWKYVDVGHNHTAAIKTDGTLWTWGLNYHGELGQGNNIDVYTPVQAGTDSDWKMVRASNVMTAAIKEDGSLWTWGENTEGSLGTGVVTTNVPMQVGTETDWKDIDLGMNYFCGAIKEDGSLWTWGYNIDGANGQGSGNVNVPMPTILASENPWKQYVGGGSFSAGLKEDGSLYVWGGNWYDELGFNIDYNIVEYPTLVSVCLDVAELPEFSINPIYIYPNPTSGILNLANADTLNIENISITDMSGKTVFNQKGNTTKIDVQHLPQGMYFLTITTGNNSTNLKFIKE